MGCAFASWLPLAAQCPAGPGAPAPAAAAQEGFSKVSQNLLLLLVGN